MRHSDSGDVNIKAYLTLAFLLCVAYAGFKIIPVYISSFELDDFIRTQTPFWLAQRVPADGIRNRVLDKARDLELPLDPDHVDVQATSASITVNLDYTVPVDLKVYTLKLHFKPSAKSKAL